MKRLRKQTNVLQHTRPRGQARFESMLGLFFIMLICFFTCGTNSNDKNSNDTYVASFFAIEFAADQILQPNVAMHIQKNHNRFTMFDSSNNFPACGQTIKTVQFTKDTRFIIKNYLLKDASHFDPNTYYFFKTKLIWNPGTKEQKNNSGFKNSIFDLSPNISYRFDRQHLWNPNLYNNLEISSNDRYKSGTL